MSEKAEEAYLKAKNINKTYYKVYTDLAELYEKYLIAKSSQIRGLYLEGLKYTNNDFQILYSFTEFLIRQKNYSEALQYLQVLLEQTPATERQPVLDRILQVEGMQKS
jgi:Tfp pilus assembly protein PilF